MRTLMELLNEGRKQPQHVMNSWRDQSGRNTQTYGEFENKSNNLSKGFLKLGLEPGDKVAFIADNIPDWLLVTYSLNNAGIVDVPRGSEFAPEQIQHIIRHSGAKAVIGQDYDALELAGDTLQDMNHVISLDGAREIQGKKVTSLFDAIDLGANSEKQLTQVTPEMLATIIYTSGTTDNPKGVMLTHENLASNIDQVMKRIDVGSTDLLLNPLPPWHVYSRMGLLVSAAAGAEVFQLPVAKIKDYIGKEPSTIIISVPRLWVTIYNGLMDKMEKEKVGKFIFDKGYKLAHEYSYGNPGFMGKITGKAAQSFLRGKIVEKMGGKLRYAISGGAAPPAHVHEFLSSLGIKVLNGYGLTETSPVLTSQTPDDYLIEKGEKMVHAGIPLDGVTIRIIDRESGEDITNTGLEGMIVAKGPNVFQGYYNNPEATKKSFLEDGSFITGDLGHLSKNRFLYVHGRGNEIIVLNTGENVNPLAVEDALKRSKYISEAVLVPRGDKVGLLVVPDYMQLQSYANKLNQKTVLDSARKDGKLPDFVYNLIKSEIFANLDRKSLSDFELPRHFEVLVEPFQVGKEINPSNKLMRRKVNEFYADEIAGMKRSLPMTQYSH